MRAMSLALVAPDFTGRQPDRQNEAAAAQRDVVGNADVDVALAQDALLVDVVEGKRVVGVDALEAVLFVALHDRSGAGEEVGVVGEEEVLLAARRP